MDEYESGFTSLGRYDTVTMSLEDRKVQKFLEGLRPSIRARLAPLDITTYEEAVRRAQLCEQDYELHVSELNRSGKGRDRDRKRSVDDRGFKKGR